jgi:tetratricopeptide (TPR) repeat protein
MRRKIEQFRERLAQFIGQREDLVQVVRCSDADAALVNKVVEGLDEASTSELFWVIVDEFKDPVSFAEACVQSFAVKHEGARLASEKQNLRSLPPLPAEVAGAGLLPPVERLRQLIMFSRLLLETLAGCAVVWAFLPMKIGNGAAYAELMAALWQHELPFPWCHHVRMIVRDSFPESVLNVRVETSPRVRELTVDFSPEAIRKALEEEAANEETPLAERVNHALILAGMDYSNCQYDRAFRQYDLVHRFATATQNPILAAIALNGLGEVKRAQGQMEQAGDFLQAAIAPAAQASSPPVPVLLNLYLNLGEMRYSQKRWEEAEVYLHGAGEFAFLMRDPELRLRSWKKLGEAQYQQAKIEDALKTWSNGAIVAGRLKRDEDHQDFVQRLRTHYTRQRDENVWQTALKQIQDGIAAGEVNSRSTQALPANSAGRT